MNILPDAVACDACRRDLRTDRPGSDSTAVNPTPAIGNRSQPLNRTGGSSPAAASRWCVVASGLSEDFARASCLVEFSITEITAEISFIWSVFQRIKDCMGLYVCNWSPGLYACFVPTNRALCELPGPGIGPGVGTESEFVDLNPTRHKSATKMKLHSVN